MSEQRMDVEISGFFFLQTPAMNYRPPREGASEREKKETLIYYLPVVVQDEGHEGESRVILAPTISPGTFRGRFRDLAGELVWNALPRERRGFFVAKVLFQGGVPLEAKDGDARKNDGKRGSNSRRDSAVVNTCVGDFDAGRDLFLDLWGGGTGRERYAMVASRVRTQVLPYLQETRVLALEPDQESWEGVRRVLLSDGAAGWMRATVRAVEGYISAPPALRSIEQVVDFEDLTFGDEEGGASPVTKNGAILRGVVTDLLRQMPQLWEGIEPEVRELIERGWGRKLSEVEKEVDPSLKGALKVLYGALSPNIISRRFLPPGMPFYGMLRVVGALPEQVGLVLMTLEAFGRDPRFGGGNALVGGLTAGVFELAVRKDDGFFEPAGYFVWNGLQGRFGIVWTDESGGARVLREAYERCRASLSDPEKAIRWVNTEPHRSLVEAARAVVANLKKRTEETERGSDDTRKKE
ncbi:hypothetical protein [Thermosulfurimonas sp. F29]|uniref:hypothetical protein n=1 Tax=Thermosulfurimonas sp. F29 TaxID=2867247 RepID=UPI001C83E98B|nr:hypothetical protein [Thermosulfurimonas sp. F29]MBX6424186.1 hypothetical protein [Thermosulfurimonas sp. F29]